LRFFIIHLLFRTDFQCHSIVAVVPQRAICVHPHHLILYFIALPMPSSTKRSVLKYKSNQMTTEMSEICPICPINVRYLSA